MEYENDQLIDSLSKAQAGGAILIVGAGFNNGATDANGMNLPSTRELTDEILIALNQPPDSSAILSDVADFAEKQGADEVGKIHQQFMRRLVSTLPLEPQKTIAKIPWRTAYTTNYDDVLERCTDQFDPLYPDQLSNEVRMGKVPLYYLHGRARDLLDRPSRPSFVASESSYDKVSDETIPVLRSLQNDVHTAKCIIVVGHSLRDSHIRSVFANIPDLIKDKVHIIVSPDASQLEVSRLDKYGHVHKIGIEGLAQLCLSTANATVQSASLRFLQPYEIAEVSPPTFEDVTRLLLTSSFNPAKYAHQLSSATDTPYCVIRSKAHDIVTTSINGTSNRIAVVAGIGNGKTNFLHQASVALTTKGRNVYWVTSQEPEIASEIETILGTDNSCVFIVDDLIRNQSIAKFLSDRIRSNQALLISLRTTKEDNEERTINRALGQRFRIIDLDILGTKELEDWDSYLERWGLSGSLAGLDKRARLQFFRVDAESENRSIVIHLFRHGDLAGRISAIAEFFLDRGSVFETAFSSLCSSSGILRQKAA